MVTKRSKKCKKFSVVGVGASAGGLTAFSQFLKALPEKTGFAFVYVQHLDPEHSSILAEILSNKTKIPVVQAVNGMKVLPDHVYVIPPNAYLSIVKCKLVLKTHAKGGAKSLKLPIDHFFASLAKDLGSNAIGVILSGTAFDGVKGLAEIKAVGGITFAQSERTAEYSGMPANAIASGNVDLVMSPDQIARELVKIAKHPLLARGMLSKADEVLSSDGSELGQIFAMIRRATGIDFTYYKHPTVKRRIKRRMLLCKIATLDKYIEHLRKNPQEIVELYEDMLIHVTGFFREPASFEVLKKKVLPKIIKDIGKGQPLRLWVPGCATGEEAYSLAILILEYLGQSTSNAEIKIFASDISARAIDTARAGYYSESAVADLSPARLRRFFVKCDGGYRVIKSVREICIFAKQDITKDPPFSNMDLISCRNLFIYLGTVLQNRAIQTFHYALKPTGFLMLGASETVGSFSKFFELTDKTNKIYTKKITSVQHGFSFEPRHDNFPTGKIEIDTIPNRRVPEHFDIEDAANKALLARCVPAAVLVNSRAEVIRFWGNTAPYLKHLPGKASLDLFKMVREDLNMELRSALQKAKNNRAVVTRSGLEFESGGKTRVVELEITPVKGPVKGDLHFTIVFKESEPPIYKGRKKLKYSGRTDAQNLKLQRELEQSKEYLQSVVEVQETTNEELKSSLEELQSSNEELQSTNEELETAKEELQSTNEELSTVNDELSNRNTALDRTNNDIINLLGSVNVAIVMLAEDLTVRRFNTAAQKTFNLISADIGRKITDIKPNIDIPDMEELILDVMDHLHVREREVKSADGKWYLLRIRPYKTVEKKIDGVVVTLIDIDEVKKSLEKSEFARNYSEAIVKTVREPMLVLDAGFRIISANSSFYNILDLRPKGIEGRSIFDISGGRLDVPALRKLLENVLPEKKAFDNFELKGLRTLLLNARQVVDESGVSKLILLAMEDITDRKKAEMIEKRLIEEEAVSKTEIKKRSELEYAYKELRDTQAQLVQAGKLSAIGELAAGLAHELSSPLTGLVPMLRELEQNEEQSSTKCRDAKLMLEAAEYMAGIVKSLNAFSRRSKNEITDIDLNELIDTTLLFTGGSLHLKGITITKQYSNNLSKVRGDKIKIKQVIMNMIANASDAMPNGGNLTIKTHDTKDEKAACMEFIDDGCGIEKEDLDKIFTPFFTTKEGEKGVGLGLSVSYDIIKEYKGTISVKSEQGKGTAFTIQLPVARRDHGQ